ncbi:subtilisin-like protease sbt3.5 [Phtheirospermum japonicum]|uniref:Subtilisin-like protease sbt3.5 n=1 Tax=Phtheirospermum japonicum TaxID=374723 RepID=A0A830BXM4_9LAMI|nr:subtilisin-like protease sbt3.5 [Phtheirospermum japonicum]
MADIHVGGRHACGINNLGFVICGGDNSNGQLNVPSNSAYEYRALSLGANHSCAIRRLSRTVVCWGGNGEFSSNSINGTSFELIVAGIHCVLGEHSGQKTVQEIEESHHSHLLSVKETEEDAKSSLVYSYKHSINGFSAFLTPHEASKLSGADGGSGVCVSEPSTEILFAHDEIVAIYGFFRGSKFQQLGDGKFMVEIQIRQECVWPESQSFSDEGMDDIPESWKGRCQSGDAFNSSQHCNKLPLPRDKEGHGTHTASTAGGRMVKNVSALGGFATGTASGGAPLARLAIYKVCWSLPDQEVAESTCFDDDILAAMDDAISDGVDVLSMSIGSTDPSVRVPYDQDGIAIGALHAVKKNIIVACSAGNSGPTAATVSNMAPWIITVGASSVDRMFPSPVMLGMTIKSRAKQ